MRKKIEKFYFLFLVLIVISMSGCGSSHSDLSDSDDEASASNYEVKQVAVITSPALERYKSYKILTGSILSGINDARYFVANIGSESSQSTLQLGLSDELSMDQSFVIINSATNDVVFAYNPFGIDGKWKDNGNVRFLGGKELRYRSLTIDQTDDYSIATSALPSSITNNIIEINLNGSTATCAGESVTEYKYVWNSDIDHSNEYYTDGLDGTEELSDYEYNEDVFIAHDIHYMNSSLNFSESETVKHDEEDEYAVYYSSSIGSNYIFATLPVQNGSTLSQTKSRMTHTAQQAYNNPVLHIASPGVYSLKGKWNGQILIEADAVIILNGVTVNCTVAPAIIFDCDTEYGEQTSTTISRNYKTLGETLIDTLIENSASLVVISDDTENNFTGSNVYRMLLPEFKTSSDEQKKRYKTDGAFYSYTSLGIIGGNKGTGVLNIKSTSFEGLDSELHIAVEGGKINIEAPDDGINVNEDDLSIFTLLDGTLTISSDKGDGIDSNGYVAVNGGKLNITAGTSKINSVGEAGIDSENEPYISSSAEYNWQAANSNNRNNQQTNTTPNYDYYEDYNNDTSIDDDAPYDADLYSSITTTRGTTTINLGTGRNLSFMAEDSESYNPRTVSRSGNVFRLERKVNIFSGIVTGR